MVLDYQTLLASPCVSEHTVSVNSSASAKSRRRGSTGSSMNWFGGSESSYHQHQLCPLDAASVAQPSCCESKDDSTISSAGGNSIPAVVSSQSHLEFRLNSLGTFKAVAVTADGTEKSIASDQSKIVLQKLNDGEPATDAEDNTSVGDSTAASSSNPNNRSFSHLEFRLNSLGTFKPMKVNADGMERSIGSDWSKAGGSNKQTDALPETAEEDEESEEDEEDESTSAADADDGNADPGFSHLEFRLGKLGEFRPVAVSEDGDVENSICSDRSKVVLKNNGSNGTALAPLPEGETTAHPPDSGRAAAPARSRPRRGLERCMSVDCIPLARERANRTPPPEEQEEEAVGRNNSNRRAVTPEKSKRRSGLARSISLYLTDAVTNEAPEETVQVNARLSARNGGGRPSLLRDESLVATKESDVIAGSPNEPPKGQEETQGAKSNANKRGGAERRTSARAERSSRRSSGLQRAMSLEELMDIDADDDAPLTAPPPQQDASAAATPAREPSARDSSRRRSTRQSRATPPPEGSSSSSRRGGLARSLSADCIDVNVEAARGGTRGGRRRSIKKDASRRSVQSTPANLPQEKERASGRTKEQQKVANASNAPPKHRRDGLKRANSVDCVNPSAAVRGGRRKSVSKAASSRSLQSAASAGAAAPGAASSSSIRPELHRAARRCEWDKVSELCKRCPWDAKYADETDGNTALHMAVMSHTNPLMKHTTEDFQPAPMSVIEDLLVAFPGAAVMRTTNNGQKYTPLHCACLVTDRAYDMEAAANMVTLIVKLAPASAAVLDDDDLSALDLHIMSYSTMNPDRQKGNKSNTAVLRSLLTEVPSLASTRVTGPFELLYRCNKNTFMEMSSAEFDGNASECDINMNDWWAWNWALVLLRHCSRDSCTRDNNGGGAAAGARLASLSAVHAAANVVGCPHPILKLAVLDYPGQVREPDLHSGNLPLHNVCSWAVVPDAADAGVSGDNLMLTLRRKEQAIDLLLREYPEAAMATNTMNKSPLQLAVETCTRWDGGLGKIARACPGALIRKRATFQVAVAAGGGGSSNDQRHAKKNNPAEDPLEETDGMYPFMVAAVVAAGLSRKRTLMKQRRQADSDAMDDDLEGVRTTYCLLRMMPDALMRYRNDVCSSI